MKKRLLSLMTMWLLISICLSMIPSQRVEAASKVTISATKKTLQVGQTYKISLKNAGKVSWKTGNKSVAVVTAKGKNTAVVKAKRVGKVTITAYYKGKRYSCKITVENPALNATNVQLYSLDEESRSFGAGSASYRQEFQFKVKGTSQRVRSWRLVGEDSDYFEMSPYGKVLVAWDIPYGEVVSAQVVATLSSGKKLVAKVSLRSAVDVMVEQRFKDFRDTYITPGMTQFQKVEKIAWYAGAFSDYESGNCSWLSLLLDGKGDCYASRILVAKMCHYLGIKAEPCNQDYHGETIVKADGKYYTVVTGYKEPKPRGYMIYQIETDDIRSYCWKRGVDVDDLQ